MRVPVYADGAPVIEVIGELGVAAYQQAGLEPGPAQAVMPAPGMKTGPGQSPPPDCGQPFEKSKIQNRKQDTAGA